MRLEPHMSKTRSMAAGAIEAAAMHDRFVKEVLTERFEAVARYVHFEIAVVTHVLDKDGGFSHTVRRQTPLGTLACGPEQLHHAGFARDVTVKQGTGFVPAEVHQARVQVSTTQVRVPSRCLDFDPSVLDDNNRHVKRPTAQIAACRTQSQRRRFGDDLAHVEPRNGPCDPRALSLGVVKVGRNRDDSVAHVVTHVALGELFHVVQQHGGELFWHQLFRSRSERDLDDRAAVPVAADGKGPVCLDARVVMDAVPKSIRQRMLLHQERTVKLFGRVLFVPIDGDAPSHRSHNTNVIFRFRLWLCIGIDLGTTFCCVGVYQADRVHIISNECSGQQVTASYVGFTPKDRLVGFAANEQATKNAGNTIFDAKRLIDRGFTDAKVVADRATSLFQVHADAKGKPQVVVD
ncbi:Aste57867_11703 [Aphanomyces stellatus]|uniref:Aste57867_11703 protein n=1 Tax=Aphanomyces stellatus TaxID=120398 RepID=A0A485KTY8_9STRA|nr:hypothetical protein As57867_011660 [Aphanomyces stellatus]VFT88560.1 Aste57867_11703 [Aphanomyces stellatus]